MLRYGLFVALASVSAVTPFVFRESRYNITSQEAWCREAAKKLRIWVILLAVAPFVINLCTVAVVICTVVHVKRLKSVTEAITSSTHWLTRTATRVGLGPSAHRSLFEYARSKGYNNLIPQLCTKESYGSSRSPRP